MLTPKKPGLSHVFFLLSLCSLLLLAPGGLPAAETPPPASAKPAKAKSATPGLEAAQAISTITGVAISPLLGVSAVGAYRYYNTPPEHRAALPWFAQTWFFVPALLLVALVFVKDTFGAALPTAVKKPFDVAETIENKISGLVAAGAFVPFIAIIFHDLGLDGACLNDAGMAMASLTPLLNILTVPAAVAAFAVVWLVSHVMHVLILISPFTSVDTALKGFRLFLLSTVTFTSFANPYVGAAWSLVLILICWLLSGWAFRLFVFGTVFTWDLGTMRKLRFKPVAEEGWGFTSRKLGGAPIRTYGRFSRGTEGELILTYRPWLVLPARTLSFEKGRYAVGRGLFYSEIISLNDETTVLTLPPRFRDHEEEVTSLFQLAGVHEIGVVKGLKTLWHQIKGLFGAETKLADRSA